MSSQELDNIVKVAKEPGLQGKDLADYIREERVALGNAEKEERQKEKEDERQKEKEKEDREERQKERDREDARKEKAAALEIEKIKLEAAERDKERDLREREAEKVRQHELTMANLRNNAVATVGQSKEERGAAPKLPLFDEDTDAMGANLHRFAIYAQAQNWAEDKWATNLSALLKGNSLQVYYRLPLEKSMDYRHLKNELLRRYQRTEEGFKEKF
jgi:hypothetical protein